MSARVTETPHDAVGLTPQDLLGMYRIVLTARLLDEAALRQNRMGRAPFVVQASVTTWQAYNVWGGSSLYANQLPDSVGYTARHAYQVSFDRPYEYQRLAPTATFALAPATTALGAATGFDAAGSGDPDGDPISLAWGFGDGATGSGAQASHTFAAPGSYQATLTATDSTGLSASATRTASVVPAPPAPATGTSPPPALALSGLSESTVRWLAGARLASATRTRLPLGTTFRFNLNRATRVRFDFTQQRAGRRVARRCVAQTARNVRRPRCRRTVTVGTLSLAAHAGANRVRFQGRISRTRTLRPGRYTAVVSATDAAGRRTTPRSLSFTIVKP